MKVKLYALTYKVANYKKTCSDHNAFIFNMYMKINKNKTKNNCDKNETQWRFKKFEQITKDSTIFNNSFTQQSNSLKFQKQYDQWEKKLDIVLYTCFKKYQHKKKTLNL